MAFDSTGTRLFVVGTEAQSSIPGNGDLLAQPTGFVRSMLYSINVVTGVVVRADLNSTTPLSPGTNPVTADNSLAHPTDVVVYKRPDTGVEYACVTAFNSDRFGIMAVNATLIRRCNVETGGTADPSSLAGPRGLAVWESGTAANDRVYILNSLDSSITVLDPNAGVGNPTWKSKTSLNRGLLSTPPVVPSYITAGRKFLYSTQFSGNGFVACASCHVDGRSDQMQWRLTAKTTAGSSILPPLPTDVPDARDRLEIGLPNAAFYNTAKGLTVSMPNDTDTPASNANAKGPMITQSLQGLVNFECAGDLFESPVDNRFDDLVSNAPYHWRGDKDGFRHFNEAFVNLQGDDLTSPPNTPPEPDGGVSGSEMKAFEQFVNSIHYPPNPLERLNRTFSGTMWTSESESTPGAPGAGTGALLGLKLYHTVGTFDFTSGPNLAELGGTKDSVFKGRSCVQCHALPEGSNNRTTMVDDQHVLTGATFQPLESTALRGLTQKEAVLEPNASIPPATLRLRTGEAGMGHRGNLDGDGQSRGLSRNEFLDKVSDPMNPPQDAQAAAINAFVREIDHGIGPIVGRSVSVFSLPVAPDITAAINELEGQADEANCGLAVYARVSISGSFVERGYWFKFDNADGVRHYKRVGNVEELTQANLLQLLSPGVSGQVLIFKATPLGMERQVAALNGVAESPGTGGTLTLSLIGTTPDSAYDPIADPTVPLVTNWAPPSFVWGGDAAFEPLSLRATRKFQTALATQGVAVRHDAPRRLQVTGNNLLQGAKIRITLDFFHGVPSTSVELPIYPTGKSTNQKRIWETDIEFDPSSLYSLMLGGPADAEVLKVLRDDATGNPTPKALWFDVKNEANAGWTSIGFKQILYPKVNGI